MGTVSHSMNPTLSRKKSHLPYSERRGIPCTQGERVQTITAEEYRAVQRLPKVLRLKFV